MDLHEQFSPNAIARLQQAVETNHFALSKGMRVWDQDMQGWWFRLEDEEFAVFKGLPEEGPTERIALCVLYERTKSR